MAYAGRQAIIPLGKGGLYTDVPQTDIPPNRLSRAENVVYYREVLQKEFGTRRWNSTPIIFTIPINSGTVSVGIKEFFDFWPSDILQRLIVLTKNGQVFKFTDQYNSAEVKASGAAPKFLKPSTYSQMVAGGGEQFNANRKLFIFDGYDSPQVISGDGTVRTNIAKPPADWTQNNQPFAGVVHRGSLWAYGNSNNPHTVYKSSPTNHEDFTSTTFTMTFYPGEGERIVGHFVWLGRLWFVKFPNGLYYIDDSDPNSTNWVPKKSFDTFGGVSPHGQINVFDDTLIANSYGSITSLKSTNYFGDVLNSDIFSQIGCMHFIREELRVQATNERQMIYYQDKKELFVMYQSAGSNIPNRIIGVNYRDVQMPKVRVITKDAPSCLGLIKDQNYVQRPAYGADDGYIYLLDQVDRQIEDQAANSISGSTIFPGPGYAMILETGDLDLGTESPQAAEKNKNFDFLEIKYEPTGRYNLFCDVFIDGRFYRTLIFLLEGDSILGEFKLGNVNSPSGSRISGKDPKSLRKKLGGMGRRIKVRFYDAGNPLESFKLIDARIYYRLSAEQEKE